MEKASTKPVEGQQKPAAVHSHSISVIWLTAGTVSLDSTVPFQMTAFRRHRLEGFFQEATLSYIKLPVWHHVDSPCPPTHPLTKQNKNPSTFSVFPNQDALKAKSLWGPNTIGILPKLLRRCFSQEQRYWDARWLTGRWTQGRHQ